MYATGSNPEVQVDPLPSSDPDSPLTLDLRADAFAPDETVSSYVHLTDIDPTRDRLSVDLLSPTRLPLDPTDGDSAPRLPRNGQLDYPGSPDRDDGYVEVSFSVHESKRLGAAFLIAPGDATSYRFPKIPEQLQDTGSLPVYPAGNGRLQVHRIHPTSFEYDRMRPRHRAIHRTVGKSTSTRREVMIPEGF